MLYLLDTNTWAAHLNRKSAKVKAKLDLSQPEDICLCSVVLGELWYGVECGSKQKLAANLAAIEDLRSSHPSLPFDDRAARHYAEIRADLRYKGTPIGPNDLFIAAIARANGATVVTDNLSEFQRVPGLLVESWL